MAKLIYSAISSLDLFVEDAEGGFDWARPDPEVFAFVNELERQAGTYLYGRRMYQTMAAWETLDDPQPEMQAFAQLWRAADKVVFSRTLDGVSTARTRLVRDFDPDAIRKMKAAAERDLTVGGAELAGQALQAGLVDEIHLFLVPKLVGGGKRALPAGIEMRLELLDARRFESGFVHLHHRSRS